MGFTNFLAGLWLLALPFHHFSVVGTFSVDNIIAPLLFILLVAKLFTGSPRLSSLQTRNLTWTIVAIVIYLVSHTINLVGTQHLVWLSVYDVAKSMLYFLLPVLFIRDERDLGRASDLMVVVMFVGCVTALMSARGLVSFEFARVAESRLGSAYLPKSVGVLDAYGDMALLIALALLLAIGGLRSSVLFGRGSTFKLLAVLLAAIFGIAAMQSRNIVFTVALSVIVFYLLGRWRKSRKWKATFYSALGSGVAAATVVVVLFSDPLLGWVEGLGGTSEAKGTVVHRLAQYQFAWSLIHDRVLLGADPAIQETYAHTISMIHNLWLKELVRGGVFGIVAILFIYMRAIARQVANLSGNAGSLHAKAYLAALVGGLVATQLYPASTSIFWVLMGISTAAPSMAASTRTQFELTPTPISNALAVRRTSAKVVSRRSLEPISKSTNDRNIV